MGKRASASERNRITEEAARIICEEAQSDYRLAKQKAVARLGLGPQAALPSNADVHEAVIRYQKLFGGRQYASRLQAMRKTALQAMRLLAEFQPRLVGAVATGATTEAHHVQLHCFADKPERIDILLHGKGIDFEVEQRRYRYADGTTADVPILAFEAGEIGVRVAIFSERQRHHAPLSPVDGQPMKRIGLSEVEALAAADPDVL